MKVFLEHFQKKRHFYTILTAIILVLGFSILMPFLIQLFNIPSFIISMAGIITVVWWKFHVVNIFKIKSPIFLKMFKETRHRIIADILIVGIILLLLFEMKNDLHGIADSAMSMTISYYLTQWVFKQFEKFYIKSTEKLEYFAAQDYEKLKAYLEKYDYFLVGNRTINDYYSMKINFPADNSEDVMEFFNFFLMQPKFAFLVAKIFKDINLDANHNIYINNKLETNPSKIGLHIMNRLNEFSETSVDIKEI